MIRVDARADDRAVGVLVSRRHGPLLDERVGESWLEIVHADPRIWITEDMLELIEREGPAWGTATIADDLLRIVGRNRELIYRIVGFDLERRLYLAEWPD